MNTGKVQHIKKQYDVRIQKMTTRIYEYRKRSAHTKTIWFENTKNDNVNESFADAITHLQKLQHYK